MSTYSEFFLNSKSSIVELETIEISHPNFSKSYYIVRNNTQGIIAQCEDMIYHNFDYYPMTITKSNNENDLDQIFKVVFGDLGDILPTEMDNVRVADNFKVLPIIVYRSFRSDDLTTVLNGPFNLVIKNFVFNNQGATFDAQAPSLNLNRTGEIYTFERFPMLRGCL